MNGVNNMLGQLKQQIIQCDETELMYYLNTTFEDGYFEIIAQAPNPYPQPRIYFYVRCFCEVLPTSEQLEIMRKEAREFSRTQKFY